MLKPTILIVEDQFIEAHSLERMLIRAGYQVLAIARSVPVALHLLEKEHPDMVLLDIYLQGNLTGIDLAVRLRERHIPFVYLSANSNAEVLQAAKATKPYGFLVKPFREKDVLIMLDVALYLHEQNKAGIPAAAGSGAIPRGVSSAAVPRLNNLIAEGREMQDVLKQAFIAAGADISVLLLGESGTGKELVAKGIHGLSGRKNRPFVVVDCSALAENLVESILFGHEKGAFTGALERRTGKFEQADGGTIFLDEIGELPMDMQVKFLRVLQEREVEPIGGKVKKIDVRVIAATNRNLEDEIAKRNFRLDLYYRLNVFPITLPALRDRKSDIPLLAGHFLAHYAKEAGKGLKTLSAAALGALMNYSWPGNIRELENIIYRCVLTTPGAVIETIDLPVSGDAGGPRGGATKTMMENERDHILLVLQKCNWKISGPGGAAELLEIHVSTLNSRIKKLGIKKNPQ